MNSLVERLDAIVGVDVTEAIYEAKARIEALEAALREIDYRAKHMLKTQNWALEEIGMIARRALERGKNDQTFCPRKYATPSIT